MLRRRRPGLLISGRVSGRIECTSLDGRREEDWRHFVVTGRCICERRARDEWAEHVDALAADRETVAARVSLVVHLFTGAISGDYRAGE